MIRRGILVSQRESCGKCIPCREGTRRMLEILQAITRPRRAESGVEALQRFQSVMALEGLGEVIKDTSLCGLGQTAPNPVLSTLRYFRDEYEAHILDHRCPAHVCKGLITYAVITELCTGCMVCLRNCPSEAISGAKQQVRTIDPLRCNRCGMCPSVCKFDAISVN